MDPLEQTEGPEAGAMPPEMGAPVADPAAVAGNYLLLAIQALLSAAPSGPPVQGPTAPPPQAAPTAGY